MLCVRRSRKNTRTNLACEYKGGCVEGIMFGGIYGPSLVDYFTMDMLALPTLWRDTGNL